MTEGECIGTRCEKCGYVTKIESLWRNEEETFDCKCVAESSQGGEK